MPAPNMMFYHDDDATLVSEADPIAFGKIDPGMVSATITIHLWNDKDGALISDTAISPRLQGVSVPDDASQIFSGTALSDFHSMLEGRSCDSLGTPADQQEDWSPIGPNEFLQMGDMPFNSMRTIELRLRVPADATIMSARGWQIRPIWS